MTPTKIYFTTGELHEIEGSLQPCNYSCVVKVKDHLDALIEKDREIEELQKAVKNMDIFDPTPYETDTNSTKRPACPDRIRDLNNLHSPNNIYNLKDPTFQNNNQWAAFKNAMNEFNPNQECYRTNYPNFNDAFNFIPFERIVEIYAAVAKLYASKFKY